MFNIEFNFTDENLSVSQKAFFANAAARWSQIIVRGLPDVGGIDDLLIDVSAPSIDGQGGILGQAAPTQFRSDSSSLPYRGFMQFDVADVNALQANGTLDETILHEMGHVLGIGSRWRNAGLLVGAGGANPRFIGARATAEYNNIFGVNESSVPVENIGGTGTRDGHWRESVLGAESMTGFLDSSNAPVSRITAASLADIGYEVNLNAADSFIPSATALI